MWTVLLWNPHSCLCWTVFVSQYKNALLYVLVGNIQPLSCIKQTPIWANVVWLSCSCNCSVLKIQFVLTSAALQVVLSVPCSCALDVYCSFPSWEMTENKSSNFFTWILPTLRKCNVIKPNHLQMVKWAVQPSAIKAMMCLLNKVCFSKPYETLSLAINLVAPSMN